MNSSRRLLADRSAQRVASPGLNRFRFEKVISYMFQSSRTGRYRICWIGDPARCQNHIYPSGKQRYDDRVEYRDIRYRHSSVGWRYCRVRCWAGEGALAGWGDCDNAGTDQETVPAEKRRLRAVFLYTGRSSLPDIPETGRTRWMAGSSAMSVS